MNPVKLFSDHPKTVGETYIQHLISASSFAGTLFAASLACVIHAILPFAFEHTGSRLIERLYQRMVAARHGLNLEQTESLAEKD